MIDLLKKEVTSCIGKLTIQVVIIPIIRRRSIGAELIYLSGSMEINNSKPNFWKKELNLN